MERFTVYELEDLENLLGSETTIIVEYVGEVTADVLKKFAQYLYSNHGLYVHDVPMTWELYHEYKKILKADRVANAINLSEQTSMDDAMRIVYAIPELRKMFRKGGIDAVINYCHGYCHGYDVGTSSPVSRERRTIVVYDEKEEPYIRTSPKYWEQYSETLLDAVRAFQSVQFYKSVGIEPDWPEPTPEETPTDWYAINYKERIF